MRVTVQEPLPHTFDDIELVCGDSSDRLTCSSALLAAHSSLLRSCLTNLTAQVILLPDWSTLEVDSLIRVMYGELEQCHSHRDLLDCLTLDLNQLIPHPQQKQLSIKHQENISFECPRCFLIFKKIDILHRHLKRCRKGSENFHQSSPSSSILFRPQPNNSKSSQIESQSIDIHVVQKLVELNGDSFETLNTNIQKKAIITSKDGNTQSSREPESTEDQRRRFPCNYCGKKYLARDHLLSHVRTHTGERPWQCEKCEERFMYRSTWSSHQVRCGEGPAARDRHRKFGCRFCPSSFLARDHLRQHERIHTGERPWQCQGCRAAFQYRNRWKSHVRKCTGTEPVSSRFSQTEWSHHKRYGQFKCPYCDQIFRKTARLEKHCETVHSAHTSIKNKDCSYLSEHSVKHGDTDGSRGLDVSNNAGDDLVLMMVNTEEVIQTEVVDSWTVGEMIECHTDEKEAPT